VQSVISGGERYGKCCGLSEGKTVANFHSVLGWIFYERLKSIDITEHDPISDFEISLFANTRDDTRVLRAYVLSVQSPQGH